MKRNLSILFAFALIFSACSPESTLTPSQNSNPTPRKTTKPTDTPVPQGKTITVENTAASGPGSFLESISMAEPYDTIIFDPQVFNPEDPATITILQPLPDLNQDHLTIDASNAGVILDGGGREFGAIGINASYITVQGLHIINFNGTAITIWENAHYGTIGGDPEVGTGPLGQGNLITGNRDGIIIQKGGSHQTIAGNQIGVEFNGLVGTTYSGIQILDQSPGNIIGPENVIAFSGAPSIDIGTGDTDGVTITRNRIYGEDTVLRMMPPVSGFVAAPVILSSDPSGMVGGVACPDCEVEIFSGEGRWAEFYEGSVIAGPDGSFVFDAGAPFSGASIKATATTLAGETSNFSIPTPDSSWNLVIQDGNTFQAKVLTSFSSREITEDNRIGEHGFFPYCWFYCQVGASVVDNLGGLGVKHIRLSFNAMEVPVRLENPEYLDANHDVCIDAFQDQELTISYILSFWNKEAQNAGEEVPCERFTNVGPGDSETEDYLQYVRDTVEYLSSRGVHEYEIWNEPDNFACTQGIKPYNYISLVSLVVPEIRVIDPEAKIYVGAPSGTNGPFAKQYLWTIADADEIMPIVDGLTWHPFYGASPDFPEFAGYYANYPAFVEELKDLATDSGFSGEYRADELTWRGKLDDPDEPYGYDVLIMPKYYARGILMHLGMDIAAAVDVNTHKYPLVSSTVRNLSTVMAGNRASSQSVTIESEARNILSYSFVLSNDDQLFTLWTNGAAGEYDSGVNATLTFTYEDNMPISATGIDVLQGYSQPLVFEVNGNQLTIRDLRVKDYPIMIQFGNAQ